MGKKRIIKKGGDSSEGEVAKSTGRGSKRKVEHGILHINASYNNTMVSLTDMEGHAILASSSGAMGFKGSKKGTPFAASKVGELLADKGQALGLKEVSVVIKGVGAGREAALRAFISKGVVVNSISDRTPIPFNGPKAKKARRV